MLALVIVLLLLVGLLCVVITGLLRSHADILRALHQLGVGLGDPAVSGPATNDALQTVQPVLPRERQSSVAYDITGLSPEGDAVAINVSSARLTLLAFLSSGCSSCAGIWDSLADRRQIDQLPHDVRILAVTKGPDFESPEAIRAKAPPGLGVVMSTQAWSDYEVPGSPFFALVDGSTRSRLGEGVAAHVSQLADLVRRAYAEPSSSPATYSGSAGARFTVRQREDANDEALLAAGIGPGHPSLYPNRVEDAPESNPNEKAVRRDKSA